MLAQLRADIISDVNLRFSVQLFMLKNAFTSGH